MQVLTKILEQETKEITKVVGNIKNNDVNNYIIELIRISEKYIFTAKPRRIRQKKEEDPQIKSATPKSIESQLEKPMEEKQEEFLNIQEAEEDIKIYYGPKEIKVDYSPDGKNPFLRPLELWELTGFYQEKSQIAKVKVQLWPEHLPYDHFKRKRAFLFT